MRLIADENVPAAAVEALRAAGHDVVWVREDMAGSSDQVVLERAAAEGRLLLTFDKDFGELAFRHRFPAGSGIVLLRVAASSATNIARIVLAALSSRSDWAGHFSVVDEDSVRMTPLPTRTP